MEINRAIAPIDDSNSDGDENMSMQGLISNKYILHNSKRCIYVIVQIRDRGLYRDFKYKEFFPV